MAVERLFPHFKDSNAPATAVYDPGDPASYNAFLQSMMEDSQDYENAILAGDRSEAQLYYYGYEPSMDYTDVAGPYRGEDPNQTLGELLDQDKKNIPNRSTYVSTDVKDAILLMLPSLIRLFGASENPVDLVPRSEADAEMAQQATSYVNYVFWNDNPGFLNLYGAIKDALTVRTGFLKWWSEDRKEIKRKRFQNITIEQLQMVLSEDLTAEVAELGKPVKQHAPTLPPQMAGATSGPAPAMGAAPGAAPPVPPPLLQAPELMALRLDRWLVRRREARRQGFSRQEVRQVLDLRMLRVLHLAARHQDRSQALHPQPDSPPSSRPSRRRSPTSTRSSGTKSPSR